MKLLRRFLIILVLSVLCMTLMTLSAFAAEEISSGVCGDNLTWVLNDVGTLTISGEGDMYDYDMCLWYPEEDAIRKIIIEDGVTSIGEYAFFNCYKLTDVVFPTSLTSIDEYAFYGCCSLVDVVLPSGVTYVGDWAFGYCNSISNLTLSSSLIDIGNYGFYMCTALTEIDIPSGVNWIGEGAFCYCIGLKEVYIPAYVHSIGDVTFSGCYSLTTVLISNPDGDIGSRAFSECKALEDLYYMGTEDDWARINMGEGNEYLTNADIHFTVDYGTCGEDLTWTLDYDGVLNIFGTGAMSDWFYTDWEDHKPSITAVEIENGVTSIGNNAFQCCANLMNISIPDSVLRIGDYSFYECVSLTDIRIPDGVTYIGDMAFYSCPGLTAIEIPDAATYIGDEAFEYCTGLTSVTIPSKVTFIGWQAFGGCGGLKNITISEGVTCIDRYAFVDCGSVTRIMFPQSLTEIGKYAFSGCGKLVDVYYAGSESQWQKITFGQCNNDLLNANIYYDAVAEPRVTKLENTASGIKLTWGAVDGAAQYRVFVKTSKGWATLGTTSATSFVYTGAKSGSTYTFTVRCVNEEGTAFTSTYNTSGWRQKYIAQPTISKFENVSNGIKISWNKVNGAERYRVYAKTSKGWLNLGTTTGTSFVYTGAKSGLTYTFTVRCVNDANTAFTSSYNTTGWRQKYIAQPTITKFENVSNGIKISWNKVSGAERYRVYAKTSKGWLCLGHTTGTSFVYTGAKSGLTYTFTVRCVNAANTAFTSSFNTTGWRQKYIAQPTVTKLQNTTNGIKVTWGAISGAERYRVYVKTSKGWTCIGTTTGTSFTWTGAKEGYTYTFTVRCVNAANNVFTSSYNTSGWRIKRT